MLSRRSDPQVVIARGLSTSREHKFRVVTDWAGAKAGRATDPKTYSRELLSKIEGKASVSLSTTSAFNGDDTLRNPEDLLMESLASCYTLSYLSLLVRSGMTVVSYSIETVGTLKYVTDSFQFTEAVLRPTMELAQGADVEKAKSLAEKAHHVCFISRSINFDVKVENVVVKLVA